MNWVSHETESELRSGVTRGWLIAGVYAILAFALFMGSISSYSSSNNPWITLTLLLCSALVLTLFLSCLSRALEQSRITSEAIAEREINVRNEITMLLAEIEIELEGK